MFYTAKITKEGKHWLAEFVDAPGCQTFADSKKELIEAATEALIGWLEANLESGKVPSRPAAKLRREDTIAVDVPLELIVPMRVRWARTERKMTQGDLALLVGVSQQQIAKLEKPGANASVETLNKVAVALGKHFDFSFSE